MKSADQSGPLFPSLSTIPGRYAMVKDDGTDYLADPLNERKAEAFARTSHTLIEWVALRYAGLGYGSKQNCLDDLYSRCPNLRALRDFSNRAKHWQDDSTYLREQKRHNGAFSREFSRAFDISALLLVLKDGDEIYYEDVVKETMAFWEAFLIENNIQ